MFTGLIEACGEVVKLDEADHGVRLGVRVPASMDATGSAIGDSIAINGCCLTIVGIEDGCWSFEAGEETLSKTNLGALTAGAPVNLERSLPVDGRLGGHFVQGHVDGVATVSKVDRDGDWVTMWFQLSGELARQLVPKGSVAVDGISLTVVDAEPDRFSVALIPHTLEVTTLGRREPGDRVNIETDILGKYVRRFLEPGVE